MDIIVRSNNGLYGEVHLPPSKSYGQRAILSSFLVPNIHVQNIGESEDELAALTILKSVGAKIYNNTNGGISIENAFNFDTDIKLNCGESGLCTRLLAGLMLLNKGHTTLDGRGSLLQRPINTIFNVYRQIGVDYTCSNGRLPIQFTGKRTTKNLQIDGSASSQYISGLLYYLVGLRSQYDLTLSISEPKSLPYIDMTIDLLQNLGATIHWEDHTIVVKPSLLKKEATITVEGDWSAASYWLVAGAIQGQLRLTGLHSMSLQADKYLLDILKKYGAKVEMVDQDVLIKNHRHLAFDADINNAPDLAPSLAVLAIFSDGESTISGVHRLVHKESNRLNSIINWLETLRIPYNLLDNRLIISGQYSNFKTAENSYSLSLETFHDHRMAMAGCILASFLPPNSNCHLNNIQSIQKSYPNFLNDLTNLGGIVNSKNMELP